MSQSDSLSAIFALLERKIVLASEPSIPATEDICVAQKSPFSDRHIQGVLNYASAGA